MKKIIVIASASLLLLASLPARAQVVFDGSLTVSDQSDCPRQESTL